VYDAVARELLSEARRGRITVVDCLAEGEGADALIKQLVFVRTT
jgi:hypothetical protein